MLPILLILPVVLILGVAISKNLKDLILISLSIWILNLVQTLILMILFDNGLSLGNLDSGWQYIDLMGKIGVDGISLWLIWLVNMLMPIVILSLWKAIPLVDGRSVLYSYKLFIILCTLIGFWSIAVFMVLDILLFYISFEGVLIPMYYLITNFGSRNKTKAIHASYMFFIYTLFGSMFLFVGILAMFMQYGTLDYQTLLSNPINSSHQYILWLAFFICFAVKLPQVPFHIWLLTAHVEAPTAASVILAAILLKLGSYGLLRYSIPLFPLATEFFRPLVFAIGLLSVFYSCIAALSQIDMKLIIAYSSVGHVGTTLLGLFSNDLYGIMGGVYFMISHGLISSALFLLVGVLYDRYHTRTILYFRGLVQAYPLYVLFLTIFSLANSGFPLTSGFLGEFLALLGVFHSNPLVALLGSLSIVLVPAFMLNLLHRISFGSFTRYMPVVTSDITRKEFALFIPLLFFTLLLGIWPELMLQDIFTPAIDLLLSTPPILPASLIASLTDLPIKALSLLIRQLVTLYPHTFVLAMLEYLEEANIMRAGKALNDYHLSAFFDTHTTLSLGVNSSFNSLYTRYTAYLVDHHLDPVTESLFVTYLRGLGSNPAYKGASYRSVNGVRTVYNLALID